MTYITDFDDKLVLSSHQPSSDHPSTTAQRRSSSNHPPSMTSSSQLPPLVTSPVLHREAHSSQADCDCILDAWTSGKRQGTVTSRQVGSTTDKTPKNPVLLCQSDRIAERQA